MFGSDARIRCLTLFFLSIFLHSHVTHAQKHGPDDPLPAGARGKVLPIQGKVLEIKGLASGVAGKTEALTAALRDLGARSTDTEIRIELSSDILFDFDKANLRPEAKPALEKVATVLKSHPNASCTIEGHTDNLGANAYNQKLSERRAESVKTALVAQGITSSITTRGWGAAKPATANTRPDGKDNPEGRQKNRRVEIIIKKR